MFQTTNQLIYPYVGVAYTLRQRRVCLAIVEYEPSFLRYTILTHTRLPSRYVAVALCCFMSTHLSFFLDIDHKSQRNLARQFNQVIGDHHPINRLDISDITIHYPLVNVYITMERSTIFNGQIHYKWSIFKSTLLNCQRYQ